MFFVKWQYLLPGAKLIDSLKKKITYLELPGGPVAKTPCSQCRGAWVLSLVGELYPTCLN